MAAILKLYLDIALLRRGPEDLPASKRLLFATLAAFVLLNALLTVAFRPTVDNWLPQLLVSVASRSSGIACCSRSSGAPSATCRR